MFAQQITQYQRVEIILKSDTQLEEIAQLGIDLHCGSHFEYHHGEAHKVTLELSTTEHDLLKNTGMQTRVLIDDLSTFYADRAKRDLPKAKAQLEAAKRKAHAKNAEAAQDLGCTEDSFPVPVNFHLGSMGGFTSYQEMLDDLDKMRLLYPDLISVRTPASTTIKTLEGREVYYVKVSDNPDVNEPEAEVLYTGVHHAREPLSMMNQLYFMWYLLENYATDPKVKKLVDNTELYFIPVVNPDGYIYNETTNPEGGGLWRKNRRMNEDGTYGVDPNRNYGFNWGLNNTGSSPITSSAIYRGIAPFSEAETQIVRDFTLQHDFINAFHNHSYSNLLLRPWGYTQNVNPDEELFDEISEQMCWHNRYEYGNSNDVIYATNGDANDWNYENLSKRRILSWTPEIGSWDEGGFWPSPIYILPQCQRQMKMSLILAQSAANFGVLNDLTPYSVNSLNSSLTFSIEHLSLVPGSFTVSVSSSSPYVTSITNPNMSTANLDSTDFEILSTNFTIADNTPVNTNIAFDIVVNNGTYDIYSATIRKVYQATKVFYDAAENLDNWTATGFWGTTNTTAFEGNSCITDSPTRNIFTTTTTLRLNTPIDLSNINNPVLEYYAKWDLYRLSDYVKVEASTNAIDWTPLCGVYTKPRTSSPQPQGEGIYDGLQKDWIREQIDLSDYTGNSTVYLRFSADGASSSSAKDGIYLDNFTVYGNSANTHVMAKAVLQGAYVAGSMHTALSDNGVLPDTEPYSAMGYTYTNGGGGERISSAALSATGTKRIVDWVIIELRDPTDASLVLASRSALLQADGHIVDMDGRSAVGFSMPSGMYHVAIRHRNHLAVVTGMPRNL